MTTEKCIKKQFQGYFREKKGERGREKHNNNNFLVAHG
jgi:hypothetical protein